MIHRRISVTLLLLPALALAAPAPLEPADSRAQTTQMAVFLVKSSLRPQRNGQHHLLQRALRQLRDPKLMPLFASLLDADDAGLKVHGFLGMVECDPSANVDLARLAAIKDVRLQAEMISAAMDSDLLTLEQAKQTVAWSDLDITVRLLVASPLVQAKNFNDVTLLRQAAKADQVGRKGLAGLLLLQLGHDDGRQVLHEVDQSADPRRDQVREMLLSTALRFQFERSADWALAITREPTVSTRLSFAALQTALRFHALGAQDMWRKFYASTTDPAQQTRLALLALNLATHVNASLFDVLTAGSDPFNQKIGAAGWAIAAKKDPTAAITDLIQMRHPLVNDWALRYARNEASATDAPRIFLAIIQAFDGPERNRAQRFEDAVAATQALFERDPKAATQALRPVLTSPKTDPQLLEAILLGLIRSRGDTSPASVLDKLPAFDDPHVSMLASLLMARHGHSLTAQQMQDLAMIVRGGAGLPDTLRLQAAWIYLTHTKQNEAALTQILDH